MFSHRLCLNMCSAGSSIHLKNSNSKTYAVHLYTCMNQHSVLLGTFTYFGNFLFRGDLLSRNQCKWILCVVKTEKNKNNLNENTVNALKSYLAVSNDFSKSVQLLLYCTLKADLKREQCYQGYSSSNCVGVSFNLHRFKTIKMEFILNSTHALMHTQTTSGTQF